MYFLYIKGRGYFNGYTSSLNWRNVINEKGEIDHQGRAVVTFTYPVKYKIKFIRDSTIVKPSSTFKTEADALKVLEEINDIVNGVIPEKYVDSEYVCYNGRQVNKSYHILDVSALEKAAPKMTVKEEKNHIIHKKTNRLNIIRDMRQRTATGDQYICNTCRVSLVPNEPFAVFDGCIVCRHCLEQIWSEVHTVFDKLDNADDITTAWQSEMLAREL